MNTKWIIAVVIVAALAVPVAIRAHEGHGHKVMGTVSAVHEEHLEVKTRDGKIVTIALDQKTVYRHGKAKAAMKMLKVGDRVVVEATEDARTKTMTAKSVQMAAAPTAASK
jgi:translation initiation factor IF-1